MKGNLSGVLRVAIGSLANGLTTPFRGGNCERRNRGRQGGWPHHSPKASTRLTLDQGSAANQCRRLPLVLRLYSDRFSNFEFFIPTYDALYGEPCHAVGSCDPLQRLPRSRGE